MILSRGGRSETVQLEPLLTFRMRRAGHSHPTWAHGRWHDELAAGAEQHRVEELDTPDPTCVHVQQVVRASWGGRTGLGVLEQVAVSPHAPGGFRDLFRRSETGRATGARSLRRSRATCLLGSGRSGSAAGAIPVRGGRRFTVSATDPALPSGTVGGAAPGVRGGIVFRRELFERLGRAARLTQVSAPPGSGKTFLLRSWIGAAGLAEHATWVPVQREERDPQQFWIAVADALRDTAAGSALVRKLTAAPDLDGWVIVERLLKDLSTLGDRLWLVIDDVHELGSAEALRQLELLVMRAPPELRFVLATRHDLRLGLHRLRLEAELTQIRATDLRFTLDEARRLFDAAGVQLPGPALALLLERTEGWAAGLRLAALSLAGHPDPERFAAEFSGSERTVAEYLVAEVLERQPEQVRRLLLRTSVLERVNGPLADLLTGGSGGERILQDLEDAGAFVMSGRRRCGAGRADGLRRDDGAVFAFVLHPAPELLKRHVRHRTSHAALISQILTLLAGTGRAPAPGSEGGRGGGRGLQEPLSASETRVLRYLPTNLPAPEIADQMSVSVNTIRTHMKHLYAKLGAHDHSEAVEWASALGLLAPSWHRP